MSGGDMISPASVWHALEDVKDPEIPVISVVELGVIRAVHIEDEQVTVDMTPTFAGCPALAVMQIEVENCVRRLGTAQVHVRMVLSPPWSTDWISPAGREKLRAFGLAPAPPHNGLIQSCFPTRPFAPTAARPKPRSRTALGPPCAAPSTTAVIASSRLSSSRACKAWLCRPTLTGSCVAD